jgi:hypothetical protein
MAKIPQQEVSFARSAVPVAKQDMYIRPAEHNPNEALSSTAGAMSSLSGFLSSLSPAIARSLQQREDNEDKKKALDISGQIQKALDSGAIEDPVQASVLKKSIQTVSNERADALQNMVISHYVSRVTNDLATSMVDVNEDELNPTKYAEELRKRGSGLVQKMINENPNLIAFESLGTAVGTSMNNYYNQRTFNFTAQYEARTKKQNKETQQANLAELALNPQADTPSVMYDYASPQVNLGGKRVPVYAAVNDSKHIHFGMGTGSREHVNKLDEGVRVKLDTLAQKYYKTYGEPLTIVSAFRSEVENRAVGGAKGSKHVRGLAFDVASRQVDKVYALTTDDGKPFTASIGLSDGRKFLWNGRYDVNHFYTNGGVGSTSKSSPVELNTPNLSEAQRTQLAEQHGNLNNFMQTKAGKEIYKLATDFHATEAYTATTATQKKTAAMQSYIDLHHMSDNDIAASALFNIEGGKFTTPQQIRDTYYNLNTAIGIFGKTAAYKDKVEPAVIQMQAHLLNQEKSFAELFKLKRENTIAVATSVVAEIGTKANMDDASSTVLSKGFYDSLVASGKLDKETTYGEYKMGAGTAINAYNSSIVTSSGERLRMEEGVTDIVIGNGLVAGLQAISRSGASSADRTRLYELARSVDKNPPFKDATLWKEGVIRSVTSHTGYINQLGVGGPESIANSKNKTLYEKVVSRADSMNRALYYEHDPRAAADILSYIENSKESGLDARSITYYKGLLLTGEGRVRNFNSLGYDEQKRLGDVIGNVAYLKHMEAVAPQAYRPQSVIPGKPTGGQSKAPTTLRMPASGVRVTETEYP